MKIFRCDQIRQIDDFTIRYEPVASIDLMERAAHQLQNWIISHYERSHRIIIFTGPGNNGGDGLAVARMLVNNRYDIRVFHIRFTDKTSPDWELNHIRLLAETSVIPEYLSSLDQFPVISPGDIIIDAIFGSGLSRPVDGLAADIIRQINKTDALRISIDMPSGLFGEDNSGNNYENIIRAHYTLTFQFPKLAFMFAGNSRYTGEWVVLPIGLHADAIRDTQTPYLVVGKSDVLPMIKKRSRFDHKGNFGHGLLVAGSSGKTGACILSAGAALRSGIGLLTCHIPSAAASIIPGKLPEAMTIADRSSDFISEVGETGNFSAVGAGPGLGTGAETQKAVYKLLKECMKPVVLDADALNILSMNKDWLSLLRPDTILTPHPKEFERLAGTSETEFDRLKLQMEFSREHNCIVILKGAFTSITTSDGRVFFNSTGNPGMATAGSGDVLTGILLSLLSQGIAPVNAAVLGAYLHGLAGDIAAEELSYESMIASDIINCLGKAFNSIRDS